MAKIIAIANQKGGVGKTTTAVSLAAALTKAGKKTILIDTDSQRNATDTYGAKIEGVATLYDLLFENAKLADCIQSTQSGDIIASDPALQAAEKKFPDDFDRFFLLREKCGKLEGTYEYIIIDTPPSLGIVLSNVIAYATDIIIPLTCDRYGIQGIDLLCNTIISAKKSANPNLNIAGILLIKYTDRLNLNRGIKEGLDNVAKQLNTKVFQTKIRESVACRESQVARQSIFEYAPKSTTAADYLSLCTEILEEE